VVLVQRDFTVGTDTATARPAMDQMDDSGRFQQLSEDPAIAPLFESDSNTGMRAAPSDG